MEKCGCEIDKKAWIKGEGVILYCPLHAGAGKLLEALRDNVFALADVQEWADSYTDKAMSIRLRTLIARAEKVILKAKGEK